MNPKSRDALLQLLLCLFLAGIMMTGLVKCNMACKNARIDRDIRYEQRQARQNTLLREALEYLNDIQEIAWWEIDGNDVYVGFASWPSDGEIILMAAALAGERAINFGCHVWGVRAEKRGWRPGDGHYYAEVTARYGKIQP